MSAPTGRAAPPELLAERPMGEQEFITLLEQIAQYGGVYGGRFTQVVNSYRTLLSALDRLAKDALTPEEASFALAAIGLTTDAELPIYSKLRRIAEAT